MLAEPAAAGTALRGHHAVNDIPAAWCHPPVRRPSMFARDRLTKRLLDADEPIVTVVAPAGYGKSTAVLLWAEADGRPFAWVQLTDADNDPVRLGWHLALALDAVEPIDEPDTARLISRGRSPDLDIFPTLARILEARAPLALVLDDVHLLSSPDALRGVEALVATVPVGSSLVLVGRHLPIRVGRQRVGGNVHHVATRDLELDVAEAEEMFARLGLPLDEADAAALVARTEGWAGGVHLAALAVNQGHELASFSGRDQLVGEYLVEEVLDSTSPDVLAFLEQSATVEPMDARLLDALLEREDSGRLLAAIEASGNLFLVPLDADGRTYRYHHLFREKLRKRLARDHPRVAQRLERRASELLEQAGDVDAAIRHAVAAGDDERAADLILRSTMSRWFEGTHAQIGEWLALLGADAVDRFPAAAIATAWFGIAVVDDDLVVRACAAAERSGHVGPLADGSPSLDVALAAVRMLLAAEGSVGVVRDAEIVRGAGGPAHNPWWASATAVQASALSMLGDLDLARARFAESLAASADLPYLRVSCLTHLALLALHADDLAEADRLAREGRRTADAHHLHAFPPTAASYAVCALVAARHRRPAEAREAAAVARSVVARFGAFSPRTVLFTLLLLAQAAAVLGDRAEARVLVREAQRAKQRDPSNRHLNEQLDELAARLSSAGDLGPGDLQPLTSAELRVLEYLPTHLSLQEIAGELLISRNTAKSHSVAIYRKLSASSRAEAVAAARSLGLLAPT